MLEDEEKNEVKEKNPMFMSGFAFSKIHNFFSKSNFDIP